MINLLNPSIKVLLVEDNPGDVRLVKEILEKPVQLQFELIYADRLPRAIEQVEEHEIDVILLDLSLPGASGIETLLKMRGAANGIPIVVLTGDSDETLALKAVREGAQDYLLKQNLDSDLLKRVLRYAIERKHADQALHEREERFRALVQNSTDIIIILAADGAVVYESPSLALVMGYRLEGLEGANLSAVVHPGDLASLSKRLRTLVNQPGTTSAMEVRVRHADHTWRTLETTMTNLLEHPAIRGIVMNARDITGRKQAEEQLANQGKLLNQVSDSIISLDLNGVIQFWNQGSHALYGWSAEEVTGKSLADVILTEVVSDTMENAVRMVHETGGWSGEYQQVRKDGTRLPVLNSTTLLRDAHGNPSGYVGINRDITERKRAEAAHLALHHQLEQQNLELAAIYNATSFLFKSDSLLNLGHQVVQAVIREFKQVDCGLVLRDKADDRFIQVARSGAYPVATNDLLLTSGDNPVLDALHTGEIVYASDVTAMPHYIMSDLRTRSELVIPLKTANGTLGVLDLQSPEPDAFTPRDQRVLKAFAERAAAAVEVMQLYEELNLYAGQLEWRVARRTVELQRAKDQVEAILNQSSDAIILARSDSTLAKVNPAFCLLLGYTMNEVLGKATHEFADSAGAELLIEALNRTIETRLPSRIELVLRRKDGSTLEADMALAPITQSETPELSVICSIRDNTVRKQAELDLRTALAKERQLNELKSRFVSMVSHDFRSPMATIQLSSDLLQNYGDRMTSDKKQQHFGTINSQINHLSGLLEDTLAISKSEAVGLSLSTIPTDFVPFCQKIVTDMQQLTSTQEIRFAVTNTVGLVEIDRELLHRAIVNLLSNAIKYSPEASVIEFTLFSENEQVFLVIRDHGIGIPEDDKTQLFEVFHRAANVGDIPGTGLGLAIVKRAVDAHSGSVTVESQLGIGTTFIMTLPCLPVLTPNPS